MSSLVIFLSSDYFVVSWL